MASINIDTLSSFGQLALQLDQDFSNLERISGQIDRLDIETDNGLEQAIKLLNQFSLHGQSISEGMQSFAKTLDEARERSEKAAVLVGEKAKIIQARREEQNAVQERFNQLGAKVHEVNSQLTGLRKPSTEGFSIEEKNLIQEQLKAMDAHLEAFINEALSIKEDAQKAQFRKIERSAESLHGTLVSARSKISSIVVTPFQ